MSLVLQACTKRQLNRAVLWTKQVWYYKNLSLLIARTLRMLILIKSLFLFTYSEIWVKYSQKWNNKQTINHFQFSMFVISWIDIDRVDLGETLNTPINLPISMKSISSKSYLFIWSDDSFSCSILSFAQGSFSEKVDSFSILNCSLLRKILVIQKYCWYFMWNNCHL